MKETISITAAICAVILTVVFCIIFLFIGISKTISSYFNDIGYKRENLNGVYCIVEVGKDTNVYCPVNPIVKVN